MKFYVDGGSSFGQEFKLNLKTIKTKAKTIWQKAHPNAQLSLKEGNKLFALAWFDGQNIKFKSIDGSIDTILN